MRSVETLTVPIVLSRTSERPLHEQLVAALRQAIATGVLPAGSRLPSTRTLAEVLGVSRGVATCAYDMLSATGAIHGTRGSGTYVSGKVARACRPVQDRHVIDLRPGQPITEGFPLAAWRSAWRLASHAPPSEPPRGGLAQLRAAVAEHVRKLRGYVVDESRIVITAGPRHGLDALLRVLPRHELVGPRRPWLPESIATAIEYAHLVEWADRTGGWLVEISREATTDLKARPVPSLLTLGPPDRTVLLGDLGELLMPGLGYLVVPAGLAVAAEQPPVVNQLAAAELFRLGEFTRRRARLAAIHARKLAVVREILDVADGDLPGTAMLCQSVHSERILLDGLMLGFGHLEDSLLRQAMRVVARHLRATTSR
jgi:GntR family transcriptional regulator/MocR family aminotransferase